MNASYNVIDQNNAKDGVEGPECTFFQQFCQTGFETTKFSTHGSLVEPKQDTNACEV